MFIECPSCGKPVDDTAVKCNKCGYDRLQSENSDDQDLKEKEVGFAVLLNFVWTGLGNLYIGRIGSGIFLILIYGFIILLMFVLPIFFIPALIMWIVGMVSVANRTRSHNDKIRNAIKARKHSILQHQVEEKSLVDGRDSNSMTAEQMVASFMRIQALSASEIISQEEKDAKKSELITSISRKRLSASSDVYLFSIIPLKESGFLSSSDIEKLKTSLAIAQEIK